MPPKRIQDLRVVDDLAAGEIALPERGMAYVVYPIGGGQELPVAKVIRRGDRLFAVSHANFERCIAGDGAKFVIRGRYTGGDHPRRSQRPARKP